MLRVPNGAGAFLELSVAEDGGPDAMPVRRASQHQYRAVLHEAIVRVADAIDAHGVCDGRGRLRRAWISSLENLIREARGIDELLGLEIIKGRLPSPSRTRAMNPHPAELEPVGRADTSEFPADIEAALARMEL